MLKKAWFKTGIAIFSFMVFLGCEGLFYTAPVAGPGYVEASDGDYSNYIRVTWDAVSTSDDEEDEEEPKIVDYYRVQRSDDDVVFNTIETTEDTWYYDYGTDQARYYYYRVCAVFTDFTASEYSASDSGYRIDAVKLKVGDHAREYFITDGIAPPEPQWYEFLAQEGWPFTIETYSAGFALGTSITIFSSDDIEDAVAVDDQIGANAFALVVMEAPSSGRYFIRVDASSDDDFHLSVWHH